MEEIKIPTISRENPRKQEKRNEGISIIYLPCAPPNCSRAFTNLLCKSGDQLRLCFFGCCCAGCSTRLAWETGLLR